MDNLRECDRTERFLRLRPATEHVDLLKIENGVLADYLPQLIWILSAGDRTLLYANPSYRNYFGVTLASWDKRSQQFHCEDLHLIDEAFETALQMGTAPKAEIRLLGGDGQHRWHKMRLVPVKSNGEIAEWVVTAIDIDDMVRARQMLVEATDLLTLSQVAAGAGSWDLDLRDGKVKLSRESARLHGIIADNPVDMDLAGWKRLVHPVDADTVLSALQVAVDTKTTFNGEFRVCTKHAGLRWLSGTGRAYYDANDSPVRMIGLNFDITERKTTEVRLLKANAQAEEAKRLADHASTAKTDFLASMSHEIRTPLNSIIGYTDLLMEDVEQGSPICRKLEVIQESGAALLALVNDILDFSKIEAGQVEIDPAVFSPRALVDNVSSMLSGMAHRKGITLVRQVSSNVPSYALGDEARLRQILLNLVNNAVKFTDAGCVAISVTRERSRTADAAETIRFSVKDSGIGISADQQKRLFQRFSQVDGSINRRFGGTGLGLAICKQLIDLMQGEIAVESTEGGGSTFWFRVSLPVADAPDQQRRTGRSAEPSPTRSVHVLLVEDIAVNQELAKAVLERAGHTVDIASNGLEAVEAVRLRSYDIVLMDVQMPVMDGITATQAIRALDHASRHVPIIAMTANVLPQQVSALRAVGVDDHVGKPFRRPELLAAIARWTAKSEVPEGEDPPVPEPSNRFDTEAFGALEDLIGEASFRLCITKFLAELASRFENLTLSCDHQRLANDAHAMIQASGLLGFSRLLSILRRFEPVDDNATDLPSLLSQLAEERSLVMVDLDRYLATNGGRSLS